MAPSNTAQTADTPTTPTPEGNLLSLMDGIAQRAIESIERALQDMRAYDALGNGRGRERRRPMMGHPGMMGHPDKMSHVFAHPRSMMEAFHYMTEGESRPVSSVTLTVGAVRASLASMPPTLPDNALRMLASCSDHIAGRFKSAVARHESKVYAPVEDSAAEKTTGGGSKTKAKAKAKTKARPTITPPGDALPQDVVDAYVLHGTPLQALRAARAPGVSDHPLVGLLETLELANSLYANKPDRHDHAALDGLRAAIAGLPSVASIQLSVEAAQALFEAEKAADADTGDTPGSRKARAMLERQLLVRAAAIPGLSGKARDALMAYLPDTGMATQAQQPRTARGQGPATQSFEAAAVAIAALPLITRKDDLVSVANASAQHAGGTFVPDTGKDAASVLLEDLFLPAYRRMGAVSRSELMGRMLDLMIKNISPRDVVDMVVERGGHHAIKHLAPSNSEDSILAAVQALPKERRKALVKALLDQMM